MKTLTDHKIKALNGTSVVLVNAKDLRGERLGNLVLVAMGIPAIGAGSLTFASGPWSTEKILTSAIFISVGLFWLGNGLALTLLKRGVSVGDNGVVLVEHYELLRWKWSKETPLRLFSRIDVLRGRRTYSIQLTGRDSVKSRLLRYHDDLLSAEGFALHVAMITNLPAFVSDFANPMKADHQFARELTV